MSKLDCLIDAMPEILADIRKRNKGTALFQLSKSEVLVKHLLLHRIEVGDIRIPEASDGYPEPIYLRRLRRMAGVTPASDHGDNIPSWLQNAAKRYKEKPEQLKHFFSDILDTDAVKIENLTVLLNGNGTGALPRLLDDISKLTDADLSAEILKAAGLKSKQSDLSFRDFIGTEDAVIECGVHIGKDARVFLFPEMMAEPATRQEPLVHSVIHHPGGDFVMTDTIHMPTIDREFRRLQDMSGIDLNSEQHQLALANLAQEVFGGFCVSAGDTGPHIGLKDGIISAVDRINWKLFPEVAIDLEEAGVEADQVKLWLDGLSCDGDPYENDDWCDLHEELWDIYPQAFPVRQPSTDVWRIMGASHENLVAAATRILLRKGDLHEEEARDMAQAEYDRMIAGGNCAVFTIGEGMQHLYRANTSIRADKQLLGIFQEHGMSSHESDRSYFMLSKDPLPLDPGLIWSVAPSGHPDPTAAPSP